MEVLLLFLIAFSRTLSSSLSLLLLNLDLISTSNLTIGWQHLRYSLFSIILLHLFYTCATILTPSRRWGSSILLLSNHCIILLLRPFLLNLLWGRLHHVVVVFGDLIIYILEIFWLISENKLRRWLLTIIIVVWNDTLARISSITCRGSRSMVG